MNITKQNLEELTDKAIISGDILISSYQILTSAAGKPYVKGTVKSQITKMFKIWDTSPVYNYFVENDLQNKVCTIEAAGDDFRGMLDLVINSCEISENQDIGPFLDVKYDIDELEGNFDNFIDNNISTKGKELLNSILLKTEDYEKFKTEFAGKSHHDSCLNGLYAHTVKMLKISELIFNMYGNILSCNGDSEEERAAQKDLYFIGVILHDFGKIEEMSYGVYQMKSEVTHRVIGLEKLFEHKKEIIETYNEKWYYDLLSVISQHHNEFGEPARTVAAYLVHKVDDIEATFAEIDLLIEMNADESKGLKSIKYNDLFLNY